MKVPAVLIVAFFALATTQAEPADTADTMTCLFRSKDALSEESASRFDWCQLVLVLPLGVYRSTLKCAARLGEPGKQMLEVFTECCLVMEEGPIEGEVGDLQIPDKIPAAEDVKACKDESVSVLSASERKKFDSCRFAFLVGYGPYSSVVKCAKRLGGNGQAMVASFQKCCDAALH